MSQHPITLTGRLTETPTLSKINTDMYKVTFRVASSKRRKTDQGWNDFDPLFIGVEAWGQFAINIRASLEKGMPVVVVGSLCSSEWQDRETGQNRSRIVIKAQYVGLDLNHHVIGSKRIAVTHNLAGVNMGDTDEQEFPIDRDFTVPDSAALGDATSAENSSPAAVGDSAADSAADRRCDVGGVHAFRRRSRSTGAGTGDGAGCRLRPRAGSGRAGSGGAGGNGHAFPHRGGRRTVLELGRKRRRSGGAAAVRWK